VSYQDEGRDEGILERNAIRIEGKRRRRGGGCPRPSITCSLSLSTCLPCSRPPLFRRRRSTLSSIWRSFFFTRTRGKAFPVSSASPRARPARRLKAFHRYAVQDFLPEGYNRLSLLFALRKWHFYIVRPFPPSHRSKNVLLDVDDPSFMHEREGEACKKGGNFMVFFPPESICPPPIRILFPLFSLPFMTPIAWD